MHDHLQMLLSYPSGFNLLHCHRGYASPSYADFTDGLSVCLCRIKQNEIQNSLKKLTVKFSGNHQLSFGFFHLFLLLNLNMQCTEYCGEKVWVSEYCHLIQNIRPSTCRRENTELARNLVLQETSKSLSCFGKYLPTPTELTYLQNAFLLKLSCKQNCQSYILFNVHYINQY